MLSEFETPTRAGAGVDLLRLEAVKRRTGLGRSSLYQLINAGLFPAPVHIAGTRTSAWPSDSIDSWVAAQIKRAATSREG